MTIMQGLTALAVIGGVAYVILAKMIKKNPRVADHVKALIPGSIYEQQQTKQNKETREQVYDDRRTMI